MPLLSCRLCGKIFTSSGGRTCSACHARLDKLYPRVREYLRDNPSVGFNVEMVSEALEVDIRDVQGLVDLGYLSRDIGRQTDVDTLRRQKLAQEFESSLKQMRDTSDQRGDVGKSSAASYGQQRYGDKGKKK
ncbi:MAG: hypothetical protein FWG71_10450 [Synergistaceae bacterium]|nr:hypothetical protein [Synergistaceae bacterium]